MNSTGDFLRVCVLLFGGLVVRSVVGLSRKAAKEAFSEFLSEAPLQPDQMAFLDEVVEYLVKNGTMEPKNHV